MRQGHTGSDCGMECPAESISRGIGGVGMAGTRVGKFCTQCGSELDDSHKFCWNCGHSRLGATQVAEPVWETCIIESEALKPSSFLRKGTARWWAKATGPQGNYRAGESVPFSSSAVSADGSVGIHSDPDPENYLITDAYRSAKASFDGLASRLVADGWEPLMPYGSSYWQRQYRRRIR